MSTRAPRDRILDILDTIAEVQQFIADMTFDQFQADQRTLKAVMADFAIMGEAAGHIPMSSPVNTQLYHGLLCAPCATAWSTSIFLSRHKFYGIRFTMIYLH